MIDKDIVQSRIELALRQEEKNIPAWEQTIDMLLGDWGTQEVTGEPLLAPNVIYSTYRRLLASLDYGDPAIFAQAQEQSGVDSEDAVVATLNYHVKVLKLGRQCRLALADALLFPFGVLHCGMGRAYMTEKQLADERRHHEAAIEENMMLLQGIPAPVADDDDDEIHIQEHTLFLSLPELLQNGDFGMIKEIIDEHTKEHETRLQRRPVTTARQWGSDDTQKPFVRRVRPHDFFFEPGACTLDESGYILVRSWERLEDVKKNPQLKNTENLVADDISPHVSRYYNTDEIEERRKMEDLGRVALWNLYDLREMSWSTHAAGVDEPLRVFEDEETESNWPYRYMEGYPYSLVTFHTVPDRMAGPGIMEYLKYPQDLTMKLHASIATHAMRANSKYTAQRDLIDADPNSIERMMQNPDQGAVIWVKAHEALRPVDNAPLDPSIFTALSYTDKAIQQNSGLSDAARSVNTGVTATEVSQSGSATNILIGDDIKQVAYMYEDQLSKLLAVLKQYGPEELVFRDPKNRDAWVTFRKDSLLYDYLIKVEIPEPGDTERRQSSLLNLHHELASSPYVQGDGLRNIQKELVKAYGFPVWERFIMDPSEEILHLIELEHQIMDQGTPVEPVPGEHFNSHLEAHNKRAGELQQQMQQAQQQMMQQVQQNPQMALQMMMQNPQMAQQMQQNPQMMQQMMQNPQMMQQMMMQDPNMAKMKSVLDVYMQHIQATQQLAPQAQTGRRRNAENTPQGNPGKTNSILSAQQSGG